MSKPLLLLLMVLLLTSSINAAPKLVLIPTNQYWVTIQGTKDDLYKIGDIVDVYGVHIPAGEYGDVMTFTPHKDERLEVRHFYLNDTSPLPPSNMRRPVHLRAIITGDDHYAYGYEVSILELEELNLSDLLPGKARITIRRAAEDTAYRIAQIDLNDISIPMEVSYNAGFIIPLDRFNGNNLEFSYIDPTGNIIAQVDRSFQLPPFDEPLLLRFMEVYYIYNIKANEVKKIVVTARGEFHE